jgi:hypothetical protein
LSGLLAGIILFFTVVAALVFGIAAAYGAIDGLLMLFAYQARPHRPSPTVLVPSETHAIGD